MKIQWQKIEGNDTAKEFMSHSFKQMILLDNILLSFSNNSRDVLVFDMVKLRWESAVVTGRSFLIETSQKLPLCAINHSTIATIGAFQERNSTKKVIFESLSVNKAESKCALNYIKRLAVNLTWISKSASSLPLRVNHTIEYFEDKFYIFGGKSEAGSCFDDLYLYKESIN